MSDARFKDQAARSMGRRIARRVVRLEGRLDRIRDSLRDALAESWSRAMNSLDSFVVEAEESHRQRLVQDESFKELKEKLQEHEARLVRLESPN